MQTIKYRIYPTLLNEYAKYLKNNTHEQKQILLNRINRVSDFDEELLRKFKKGSNFEDAVLKNVKHNFNTNIVQEVQALLPAHRINQNKVVFNHNNIQFYGFADVVGEKRVIDIKTTSKYSKHRFQENFQHLYLYGLKDFGYDSMEYIIYDFEQIYIEKYMLEEIDFDSMLQKMDSFALFLDKNKTLITDKKIFVSELKNDLFA